MRQVDGMPIDKAQNVPARYAEEFEDVLGDKRIKSLLNVALRFTEMVASKDEDADQAVITSGWSLW